MSTERTNTKYGDQLADHDWDTPDPDPDPEARPDPDPDPDPLFDPDPDPDPDPEPGLELFDPGSEEGVPEQEQTSDDEEIVTQFLNPLTGRRL